MMIVRYAIYAGVLLAVSALAETHPILPAGAAAPDFSLPGVDGRVHRLADYAASPILVIIFTCNHCPIAQLYEQRIMRLYRDYRDKGVAVVAIQPNAPEALRVDELDSSDMSDTLAEMKVRAAYKHLTYPYLYDGETQSVARAYGPQATPHVFIFDRDRRLRYEGRFDNSYRAELVKTQDARDAIDALLAGRSITAAHTGVFGCSTKWKEKEAERIAALRKLEERPVTFETMAAADLAKLRANPAKKLMLVSFWSPSCMACVSQFSGIETTYRMYSVRGLDLVTVAAAPSEMHSEVRQVLEKEHSTGRNLFMPGNDATAAAKAFDPQSNASLPLTVLMAPDGKIIYRRAGPVDLLELRRTVLANFDWEYSGFSQYWNGEARATTPAESR